MATYNKYDNWIQALCNKEVDIFGTTDTLKIAIHSDAPAPTTDTLLSNLTQITGTGYTAGGEDIDNDATRTGAIVTVTAKTGGTVDVVWTAGVGGFTAGQYFSIHDTNATNANTLMCYFDYGASFTAGVGETVTADFGATLCTLT